MYVCQGTLKHAALQTIRCQLWRGEPTLQWFKQVISHVLSTVQLAWCWSDIFPDVRFTDQLTTAYLLIFRPSNLSSSRQNIRVSSNSLTIFVVLSNSMFFSHFAVTVIAFYCGITFFVLCLQLKLFAMGEELHQYVLRLPRLPNSPPGVQLDTLLAWQC